MKRDTPPQTIESIHLQSKAVSSAAPYDCQVFFVFKKINKNKIELDAILPSKKDYWVMFLLFPVDILQSIGGNTNLLLGHYITTVTLLGRSS